MEDKKCPQCGEIMKITVDGSALNYECQKCGFGIATTLAEGICWDANDYSIFLLENTNVTTNKIKVVSKLSGLNYLKSKELLLNGGFLTKNSAVETKRRVDILKESEINFTISPKFDYK